MKKRTGKTAGFTLLMLLCAAVFVFSLYKILEIRGRYAQANREYEGLADSYLQPVENSAQPAVSREEKELDLAALQAENPDCVGWIELPGTPLSYPLLHTANNEYYLDHTFKKTYNPSGAVFMDKANQGDFTSPNTILYGHNMKDGSMFGYVKKMLDAGVRQEHPYVYIYTSERTLRYRVVSVRETTVEDFGYQMVFSGQEDYQAFARRMGGHENQWHTLTLSTCTNREQDGRYLLQAVLENPTDAQQQAFFPPA